MKKSLFFILLTAVLLMLLPMTVFAVAPGYTVEFNYGGREYVLPGDSSVKLSEILSGLGIEGNVAEAESSAQELFNIRKEANGNDWTVTALQAFHSDELLTVAIGESKYEIKVTDDVLAAKTLSVDDPWLNLIYIETESGISRAPSSLEFTGSLTFEPNGEYLTIKENGTERFKLFTVKHDGFFLYWTINGNPVDEETELSTDGKLSVLQVPDCLCFTSTGETTVGFTNGPAWQYYSFDLENWTGINGNTVIHLKDGDKVYFRGPLIEMGTPSPTIVKFKMEGPGTIAASGDLMFLFGYRTYADSAFEKRRYQPSGRSEIESLIP